MEQRKLTFLITHLILRVRDYPADAVDELLAALDMIDRKYDLMEKLASEEWQAMVESRDDVARIESGSLGFGYTSLSDKDVAAMGRKHFEDAVTRARRRNGEEQGDIADLIFALLDEYLL
jgi:hypothetical protein